MSSKRENSVKTKGAAVMPQEENMIDYEEELKKFEPCLDVTDAESAIYDRELTDILDVLPGGAERSEEQQTDKIRRYE